MLITELPFKGTLKLSCVAFSLIQVGLISSDQNCICSGHEESGQVLVSLETCMRLTQIERA